MGASETSSVDKKYSYYSIAFCSLMFLAVTLPFLLTGNPILQVNDNLDGTNLVLLHVLENYGTLFSFDANVPMLHGLSRLFFPSELKIWGFLLYFFDNFLHAYLLNYLLKLVLGYTSMFFFLKKVITRGQGNITLMRIVALCFAILPCQPENAIPFATVPLIFYMFDLLYRKECRRHWLLAGIFCYPLLSDFSRFGVYIIFVLGLFLAYEAVTKKRIHYFFALGIALLCAGYVLTEYRLFYTFLYLKEETVREEFQAGHFSYFNLRYIISETIGLLVNGQYHFSDTIHKYIVLPAIVLFLLATNITKKMVNKTANALFWAFVAIIIVRFVYLTAVVEYANEYSTQFRIIQLDRIYILIPLILYSIFYIALDSIYKKKMKFAAVSLVTAQAFFILMTPSLYNDAIKNIFYSKYIQDEYSCNEYFSENLFNKIKEKIHYKGEWSVAVGFYPSVLMYNSIHTLDGYHSYYPLAYKHAFRKIIAPELKKDEGAREYFDYWGCRAYIFNKATSGPGKEKITTPVHLSIDPAAFAKLGGKYVFSQAKIGNSAELRLSFLGEFTDPSSPYSIYVYSNTPEFRADNLSKASEIDVAETSSGNTAGPRKANRKRESSGIPEI